MAEPPPPSEDGSIIGSGASLEPDFPGEEMVVSEAEAMPAAEGAIRSGKLAGRTMSAAIVILAVPVLLQQTMQAGVGMADKIFAGQLPAGIRLTALDAVGIASYVGWFIGIAMAGLGIGGQALIARAMGAGSPDQGHRALGQAMSLAVVWGVLVGAALWFVAPAIAASCSLTPDAAGYFLEYIRVLACAMPLSGVMMVGAMCLHGAGETTKPSVIAIGVNVVNVVCSWALSGVDVRFGGVEHAWILQNPFAFDLHVQGIALGTAVSYLVGAVWTLSVMGRGVKDLRLRREDLPLDRSMVSRIIRIGIPNFFEGISMWAVNLLVLMIIGVIAARQTGGEGLQGAHIIAVQWEAFSFLPGFAIGTAAGALAGQYLGAGNPRKAARAVYVCMGLGVLVMGLLGVALMVFGRQLTAIVSTEPIHLATVPRLLFVGGAVQPFFAVAMVARQGLRGVGDTRWTFAITTFSSYAIRLPAAYLLGVTFDLGLVGIWYGLCGEFVVRAGLFAARLLHGGWKKLEI